MTTIVGKQFREAALGEYREFDDVVDGAPEPNQPINGKLYEFSVAPAEQFYYEAKGRGKFLVEKWHKILFDTFGDIADYDMIVEVSVPKFLRGLPNKSPRIHFHGTITFRGEETGIAEFLNNRWHQFADVSTFKLSDYREDIWPKYIAKQAYLQKPFYGKLYHISNPLTPLLTSVSAPTFTGGKGTQSSQAAGLRSTERKRGTAPRESKCKAPRIITGPRTINF